MLRLLLAIILLLSTPVWAAEDLRDTYSYRDECPQNGAYYEREGISDNNNFIRCQCTSYVAHKLNELWGNTSPRFTNQYYGFDRWGHAKNWFDRARSSQAEIGVTGARDNFEWDENVFSAVFPGDVAYWDTGTYGHVAFVKSATPGPGNRGVGCATWTEYNGTLPTQYEFSERTMCRNADGTFPTGFPKYFLHIDKDRIYCKANPNVDTCSTLTGSQRISGLTKYGGLGGFSSNPSFDLKVNDFWVIDPYTNLTLVSEGHTVQTNQLLQPRLQLKAVNGDTASFMRPGKDRIETDIWVQEDDNEWRFYQRTYTRAVNLPIGATHTEHADYVVPPGVSRARFKGKIDAEDEASESNEGNNWSRVLTYTVDNNPVVNLTVSAIQPTGIPIPVPAGGAFRAKMALRNIGTTAPTVGIRSNYSYRPLGSSGPWTQIADDGSDPQDLVPNQDHWEEILSAVTAPTIPGWYELRGCADYQNASAESNEVDNCLTTTFEVVPPRPDFIVTAVGPAGGSSSIKAGSRFYPAMYVKNIGTANPTGGIRSAYYFSGPATGGAWVYITDDGTEASQLCVGCQYREQYDGGMKISTRGTYYFKGCADYPGWQTESNEANNCTVSGPITVY